MPRRLPVVLAALSFAPGASDTFGLAAQSAADARWLADCRDRDDGWRVKHCEVRVSSLKATGDAVTVDPGKNGAVSVKGWDSGAIEMHARIQTETRPDDQAADPGIGNSPFNPMRSGHRSGTNPDPALRGRLLP